MSKSAGVTIKDGVQISRSFDPGLCLERQLFDFENDLIIAWLPNQFREQIRLNVFAVIGHPPYGFNLPKIDDAGPV